MKNSKHTVEFTPSKFASIVGCDRHELIRRLADANARPTSETGRGREYSLRDLHNAALGGDIRAEKLRKTRAECEKLEHDLAKRRGELIEVASVKRLGQEVMKTVTTTILNMPMSDEEKDLCLSNLRALGELDWDRIAAE